MLRAPFRRGLWVSQLRALLRSGAAVSALSGCSDGDNDSGADQAAVTSSGGSTSAGSDSDGGDSSSSGGGEATSEAPSSSTDDTGDPGPRVITWHQDIAPIVARKCGGCHASGGIAPFSLETYAAAAPFAALLLDAVERRVMPPFLAEDTEECQPRLGFKDDPRLTGAEQGLLRDWVDEGAPEGDPKTAAPLPTPPELELEGADIHLKIPAPVTIQGDEDQYICFSVDPGLVDDTWIDGLQVTPGNHKVVHHVLVYLDPDRASEQLMDVDGTYPCFGGPGLNNTSLIGAWAPGARPFVPPPEVALRVLAGSRIVINVHYHPTGAVEQDLSTAVDLRRFVGVPTFVGMVAMIGNLNTASQGLLPGPNDPGGVPSFLIPAGAVGHTEEMLVEVTPELPELRLFGVTPHMHYVGTDMRIGILRADPEPEVLAEECLLQTPRWDFQWQQLYSYDADLDDLPRARPGDKVSLRCTYDNSLGNPAVVAALAEQGLSEPQDVKLGEATLDEMCLGVFGVAVALKDLL
jgi:hypothetical protein